MMYVKKGYFTLLEVLVVVFLLSIGALAVGIKLKESYSEQRFYSEVDQILDHLKMAQDLMLMLDHDIYVVFTEDKEHHLTYSLQTMKPLAVRRKTEKDSKSPLALDPALSNRWKNLVEKEISLRAIQGLSFEGDKDTEISIEPKDSHLILRKIRLRFSLGAMTKGFLKLSPSPDTTQSHVPIKVIRLLGYPSSINYYKEQSKDDTMENELEESKRLYPKLD